MPHHCRPDSRNAFTIIFLLLSLSFQVGAQPALKPPVAPRKARSFTFHGDTRSDPYYWLRERENPEVMTYITAENSYAEAVMEPFAPLREKLFVEMKSRIKEKDVSVPERVGDYLYYSRDEVGREYQIHCRKKGTPGASETVILDENELAKDKPFFALGSFRLSPDQTLLAYSTDVSGDERFTIFVRNLETNTLYKEEIQDTTYGIEWSNDNRMFFYVKQSTETNRAFQIWRHAIGTKPGDDTLVYEERDEKFTTGIQKTKDREWLFIVSESPFTSEVRTLRAREPLGTFTIFLPRETGIKYYLDHHDNRFFIHTNEDAPDFRILTTPETNINREAWTEFVPQRKGVRLEALDMFVSHMVLYELQNACKTIRVHDFASGTFRELPFDEPGYSFRRGLNEEFQTSLLRFTYFSLKTPETVYDVDLMSGKRELKKRTEVLGGFKTEDYVTERIYAPASDGARVPIDVVFRRDFRKDGTGPLLLYGYGAYGSSNDPDFDENRLSLLNRGFAYALAHIRGSEEMGREWYENGKLLKKKNTFTDFIACAEHLIRENYTSADRLAIEGMSAGGLLIGAVTNMRPDLFKAVIAEVPFVDALNTQLDPTIPLVTEEYEEWGNPMEKPYYDYIKSYSPYENIFPATYPAMLVTAGMNDPRVQYWEPVKYVARLRATKTDDRLLLLKTSMNAGHFSVSGRFSYLREIAFQYAFLFKVFGIGEK